MESYEPFLSLALAATAGLLIGLERERSAPEDEKSKSFIGGARTHPLFALLGGVTALLARQFGVVILISAFLALICFLLASYIDDIRRGGGRGLTSEAAFFMSFLLGALALSQGIIEPVHRRMFVVGATAVVATLLLSSKPVLAPLVRRTSREDVVATLKFLIVTVVVLPLLPDRTFGPLDVLNPRNIGLMMVLIAGISFVGYAAIRLWGARKGLGITGLIGGLASSTAVTLSMSSRARTEPRLAPAFGMAVMLASSIMFVRVIALVAFVNPDLLRTLAVPLCAMALVGIVASLMMIRRSERGEAGEGKVSLSNPFELSTALKFGFLFALVLLGSKAATTYLGNQGTYAAAILAGTADVDAVAISMAQLGKAALSPDVAARAVFLAVASNTVVKGGMAAAIGGWGFARPLAVAFLIAVAAGSATLLFFAGF